MASRKVTGQHQVAPRLTRAELNRATLSRQLLLERAHRGLAETVSLLGALQAQTPQPPFVALWSRVEGFTRRALVQELHGGLVVRATWLRAALHLIAADDYANFRPTLQPALTHSMVSALRQRARGLDVEKLVRLARGLLADGPLAFEALRDALEKKFPEGDARAMAAAVRVELPLVQVPDELAWGYSQRAPFAPAEKWVPPLAERVDEAALVRRYLAAFGPATVKDAQTWSGMPRLEEVFEGLRASLVTFTDEQGQELFDLPHAPRLGGDVPAPPRFLSEDDALTLAFHDARRLADDERRKHLSGRAALLLDGRVTALWRLERSREHATVVLERFEPVPKALKAEVKSEALALAKFLAPELEPRLAEESR
jgi:hypothetical protein